MSIIVTTKEQQTAPKPYPKLVKFNYPDTHGLIILKTSPEKGTVIKPGNSGYTIGTYAENWAKNKDEDYNEPITLQNK